MPPSLESIIYQYDGLEFEAADTYGYYGGILVGSWGAIATARASHASLFTGDATCNSHGIRHEMFEIHRYCERRVCGGGRMVFIFGRVRFPRRHNAALLRISGFKNSGWTPVQP